jgi:hypothetical protein
VLKIEEIIGEKIESMYPSFILVEKNTMLSYFNFLPTDVTHCEIIPFLDYHSRTAFNITLDYDEKRMYPLNRDKIAQI